MSENRSLLTRLFLTPQERRLRSGWRLIGQSMLLLILLLILSFPAVIFLPFDPANRTELMLLSTIIGFPAITISVFLARRILDRRSFVSLGLFLNVQALKDLLFGIGLAGLMMGLIFLALWIPGWLTFDGFAWDFESTSTVTITILVWLLIFILVGWYEELLARGYWLQNLAEGIDMFWAVLISSMAFAVLHLNNPNATWTSAIGLLAAGLFLAYGYLRTRLLWLPIGLHVGWNFFQGNIYGFPVSGIETYALIQHTVVGDELVTGGAFGPEAGLILFPALLVGFGLIKLYTKARKIAP